MARENAHQSGDDGETGMSVQSRMIESAAGKARRKPRGFVLLKAAESKLRQGNVCEAVELFRAIVNRYPVSLERLAALAYLRTAHPMFV